MTDVVIADPGVAVAGKQRAGVVHIVDGATGATTTVSADDIAGIAAETGAEFGFSLTTYDSNLDGCDDLVIGSPFATVAGDARAGLIVEIPGSATGLVVNEAKLLHQDSDGVPGGTEPGDEFGYSLAAGQTSAGRPFLVVGVPGDDVGTISNAGMVHYFRDDVKLIFHQNTAGVGGAAEAEDQFGFAVAATATHVAVGYPGEDDAAGGVNVFSHTVAGNALQQIQTLDQESIGSGTEEPGDRFGAQLSMVPYIPPGGTATRTMIAIGVPGESLGSESQAGRVVAMVSINSAGAVEFADAIRQNLSGVDDEAEEGDSFGWQVRLVNRNPGAPATWENLLLAVGVPGEDRDGYFENGGVQVFSMVGEPGDHDVWVDDALGSAGFTTSDYRLIGRSIGANDQHLLVADSLASPPAVYAVPWEALTGESTVSAEVYISGQNGLPSGGSNKFGWSTA